LRPSVAKVSGILATIVFAAAGALAYLRWHGMPQAAWQALHDADQYELLSLYPYLSKPDFYGHEILGRTTITDKAIQERLNQAFQLGVRDSDGRMMACFNPRHGIRVTHGDVVTEFVICFECRQVEVWRGGKKLAFFLTSKSPQPIFDEVLQQAGLPLAPKNP
jgi:hypothetical protein